MAELPRHRGRNAVAHGAAGRRELCPEPAEPVETVQPARVVAGAAAQDRVRRQTVAQMQHDLAHLHGTGVRLRRLPGLRSEEHTSALQSLMRISYAVFCLKKKKTQHSTPVLTATTLAISTPT